MKWINQQLIKAKPAFHKKTFLKPEVHKGAKFCSSCHKVHLPHAVTQYRDFLRGQNHYDAFLLSGVSGNGITSFYYPKEAEKDCNGCHMPLVESNDFGAKDFAGLGKLEIHDHTFKGANTGIAWLRNSEETVDYHQKFLEGSCRVDIFGIREGNDISAKLIAPLNPEVPVLKAGNRYLLDIVVRTLTLGHLFTQGTVDSNEIWLEVIVRSGDQVIGRSGGFDNVKKVDPWSHYLNVFMLDKDGNRINRRNAQDIFVPLYNHQIPPGAAQTVHYEFTVPEGLSAPITIETRLNYRKFDQEYMNIVAQEGLVKGEPIRGRRASDGTYINDLPVTRIADDVLTFAIEGMGTSGSGSLAAKDIPEWQRWNDYGIGLLLKGKAELRQASMAFNKVSDFDLYHGALNLSRVLYREGRLDEALKSINAAASYSGDKAAPPWTVNWMSGQIAREMGNLDDAERYFRAALDDKTPEMVERKFDFSKDYRVRNLLGQTVFDLAKRQSGEARKSKREELFRLAITEFEKVLALDVENVTAHYNLGLIYSQLGDEEAAEKHRKLHSTYKADDNARDRAVALARQKYPAANHAAEDLVIYDLTKETEFEMTTETVEAQ
ncbi:MAG: tetratricopeptide repeat protein [Pirellulaceae bacterium]